MSSKRTKRAALGTHPDCRPGFEPRDTRYERLVRLAFALRRIGVSEPETARLIRNHSPETIERLLRDIPWRRARNRVSFIVSAIDNAGLRNLRRGTAKKSVTRPAMSADQYGHGGYAGPPGSGPVEEESRTDAYESFDDRVRRLAADLARLGVSRRQVERLFARYEIDLIEQQLVWLPYRRARNQASVIVMAICENYEKPARIE